MQDKKFFCRITYNKNRWTEPSGSDGKSNGDGTFEGKYGFGLEEWLNDVSKLVDGYHYSFLQQFNDGSNSDKIGCHLIFFTYETGGNYSIVGELKKFTIVDENEYNQILTVYKTNNWLLEMFDQLSVKKGTNEKHFNDLINTDKENSLRIFNIKFFPEDLVIYEKPIKDKTIKNEYYSDLYEFDSNTNEYKKFITSSKFKFQSNINEQFLDLIESPKISEYEVKNNDYSVTYLHNYISQELIKHLRQAYELKSISENQPTNKGNTKIDIAVQINEQEYIFYEIKTHSSIKLCVREAIGQLLEYGLWEKEKNINVQKYIIVSRKNDIEIDDAKKYMEALRKLGLKIWLITFDLENSEFSKEL